MAKGITRELIINEAEKMIAEAGLDSFSLHTLAERLGIRTASLYTHISGIDELLAEASKDILEKFHDRQMEVIKGKSRMDAVSALADSERSYALKNPSFYELIMNLQLSDNKELKEAAACIVEPVMTVLAGYDLTDSEKTDVQRTFRALVYGFISQERNGYFSHFPGSTDSSFQFGVKMISNGIEALENEN